MKKGKVYYVCFYSEPEVEDRIITYPSVISKIDYVVHAVKKLQREVVVLSIAPSRKGRFDGYSKKIDGFESHVYLRSIVSGNKLLAKLSYIKHNIAILRYLIRHVEKQDKVLVYHSLYNRFWLSIYNALFPGRVILQIEDVFSELSEKTKKYKKTEWNLLRKMQKCICVNDIVYRDLPEVPQKMISYGSYLLPPEYDIQTHSTIRLVYAGVIEQERQAAFLATKAMRHLKENYELNILGFGSEENIRALEELIQAVNLELGRDAVIYHGKRSGEEYWRFLQNCDVALSTHAYDPSSFSSADYTFPSKVLTYMSNGLPVVAQRLEVLERSAIAEYISFYETPNPEAIADAIVSVEGIPTKNTREVIAGLARGFERDLKKLLEDIHERIKN